MASLFCFWGFAAGGLPAVALWQFFSAIVGAKHNLAMLALALCIVALTFTGSVLNIEGSRIHGCVSFHSFASCFSSGPSASGASHLHVCELNLQHLCWALSIHYARSMRTRPA